MPKPRIRKPHTSRRAPPLKDSDYDHEITLVEEASSSGLEAAAKPDTESPVSPRGPSADSGEGPSLRASTTAPLVPVLSNRSSSSRRRSSEDSSLAVSPKSGRPGHVATGEPAIHVQQPTPFESPEATRAGAIQKGTQVAGSTAAAENGETAIDVLYENERGGILCGLPLFSSKALGSLDPTPWTNAAHKPSPTTIHTAQVPDPSWAWAWPEWRVNHDPIGVDKDGWEYSFAFWRKCSWHGPKWWNSFVRRRAWIRRRVKKDQLRASNGGSLLQPEYFTIRSSAEMKRASRGELSNISNMSSTSRPGSAVSSGTRSRLSQAQAVDITADEEGGPIDIEDVDTLIAALVASRIDREKIEAVENYLIHNEDGLARLDEKMHEIMAFFVFQASRRVLLTRLTQLCSEAVEAAEKDRADKKAEDMATHLKKAVKHADEEMRRLEYWSDVKQIADAGDSVGAVDTEHGWDGNWEGLDRSGPAAPEPQPEVDSGDEVAPAEEAARSADVKTDTSPKK